MAPQSETSSGVNPSPWANLGNIGEGVIRNYYLYTQSLRALWPPPFPIMAVQRVFPSDPVEAHTVKLPLIDAYGPKIWIRQTHFFELQDGRSAERCYEALREGLSRTIAEMPILTGFIHHGPSGDSRDLLIEVPANGSVNFLYEDLTNNQSIPSYATLSKGGFPATDLGPQFLPVITARPIAAGSPMITAKLNHIKGGLVLGFGMNHVHADASVVAHFEKTWALHTADFSAGKKQHHWTSVDVASFREQLSLPVKDSAPFNDENTIIIPEAISPVNLPLDLDLASNSTIIISKLMALFRSGKRKSPPKTKSKSKGDLKGFILIISTLVSIMQFFTWLSRLVFGPPEGKKANLWPSNLLIAYLNGLHAIKNAMFGPPDTTNDPHWSVWYFSPESLAQLKKDASSKISTVSHISTNDALIGLFWARVAFIKQLSLRGHEVSQMVYPVNIRHRLTPQISENAFGNILDIMTVKCDNATLEGPDGFAYAAENNRKAILSWSQPRHDSWLTKAATLPPDRVICPNPVKLLAEHNFAFNDYSRSETGSISWGSDLGVISRIRYPRQPTGGAAAARVHPRLPDGGLEFALVVDADFMAALQKDEVFTRYAKLVAFPV